MSRKSCTIMIKENMSSSTSSLLISSDDNCENTCKLRLGVSETFNEILLEQQKIKTSKTHISPKIFNDPADLKLYQHMLGDVMFKILDGPKEQKIFRTALEGMERNYPEILTGKEKYMFYCPSGFNFDSRIAEDETCIPDVLDDIQFQLETKKKSQMNDSIEDLSCDNVDDSCHTFISRQISSIDLKGETTQATKNKDISKLKMAKQWLKSAFLPNSSPRRMIKPLINEEPQNTLECDEQEKFKKSNPLEGKCSKVSSSSVHNTQSSPQVSNDSRLAVNDEKNLKRIRDHLSKLRPQLAEQEFADSLAQFFYQNRGIFIHSLKLDDHLKVLTNRARLHRKQNKNLGFGLTDFEKKLTELLNISDQTLISTSNSVVNHLLTNNEIKSGQNINGRVVRKSVDHQLKGNDKMNVMKLFKPGQDYTLDEIRDGVKLGKFESECRIAGENDLLIMLPDSKMFLCIEIKRHMKGKDEKSRSKSSSRIDRNVISASNQLQKNATFISSKHGSILSPGWVFAKVCAISPSLINEESICEHCKKFILTTDILKTPGGLEKWLQETGLSNRASEIDETTKEEAYNEFQLFFNRLVCMSSVKVVPDPYCTWNQIQGNNSHHMAAGFTKAEANANNKSGSEGFEVENALKAPHHAYKILFFNKEQMDLLTTNHFPYVVFMCDFGTGKSLICKEKAIQTEEKERMYEEMGLKAKGDPVFYISMVGVDKKGNVDEHERIFDIYTKIYDFAGTNILVINAQDLWSFYKSKVKMSTWIKVDQTDVIIYELVEFFILHHPNGHYIFDECPIFNPTYVLNSVERLLGFILRCKEYTKTGSNLLWIALQSNYLADMIDVGEKSENIGEENKTFEPALKKLQKKLKKNGWVLPSLQANMRNQVNIANIRYVDDSGGAYEMASTIEISRIGSSVIGEIPILFLVDQWHTKRHEVLKHCIDLMSSKNNKNIVVLFDHQLHKKWDSVSNKHYEYIDISDDIKQVAQDKTIIAYPSHKSKENEISNIKSFIEKENHILVTEEQYFNGCETSNLIYLYLGAPRTAGLRNCILRGVQNVICIQDWNAYHDCTIEGMKKDCRFRESKYR